MATIQFELERLYDLVRETQEERDKIHNEFMEYKNISLQQSNDLEEELGRVQMVNTELSIVNARLVRENIELKRQNDEIQELIKKAENDNYALNHRIDCLTTTYRTTHEFYVKEKNKGLELRQHIDNLTNGTIKYKRQVDPDDLEEYQVEHKVYLRDTLTDAIYSKQGRLVGYIEEDSERFVKIL